MSECLQIQIMFVYLHQETANCLWIDLVEEGTLKPFAVESVNRDKKLIYERAEKN